MVMMRLQGASSQPSVLIPTFGTASIRLQPFSVFHRPWPVTIPAENYVDSPMRGHCSASATLVTVGEKTTFSFSLRQWLKCKAREQLHILRIELMRHCFLL